MLWVGVTGPMGSGKSTVGQGLSKMGYPVLDADEVVRSLLNGTTPAARELQKQIVSTFGQPVALPDGGIDRPALGRLVFVDSGQREALEKLIHPRVKAEVARRRAELATQGTAVAFYDVPLLFETKMEAQFDHILVVSARPEIRLQRACQRTGLS